MYPANVLPVLDAMKCMTVEQDYSYCGRTTRAQIQRKVCRQMSLDAWMLASLLHNFSFRISSRGIQDLPVSKILHNCSLSSGLFASLSLSSSASKRAAHLQAVSNVKFWCRRGILTEEGQVSGLHAQDCSPIFLGADVKLQLLVVYSQNAVILLHKREYRLFLLYLVCRAIQGKSFLLYVKINLVLINNQLTLPNSKSPSFKANLYIK